MKAVKIKIEIGQRDEAYAQVQEIAIGGRYEFYAEMQQEGEPAANRMRNYTGQTVTVIGLEQERNDEAEEPPLYKVRADDGHEFIVQEDEINGWDNALGQYFWPDGTFGPTHATTFLCNERVAP